MGPDFYQAWMLTSFRDGLQLQTRPRVPPRHDGVVVRVERAMVLSYTGKVLDGSIAYATPELPFVPGTNAIGVVEAIGAEVCHVRPGDRVFLSPHLVADEPGTSPAQILIGLTAMGSSPHGGIDEAALALQRSWRDGVFAELAHWPASCVTPLRGLEDVPAERLIGLAKLVVPYGGLLRAGVKPGQTVAINGATGYFGSAGVMVALAMGASRVVAIGRDAGALRSLAGTLGPRVVAAVVTGHGGAGDVDAIGAAAAGGVDVALDLLGQAASTATTSATLRSLKRGGRLVLMGSAASPLEIGFAEMLANDWEVVGNFMYPRHAPADLAALAATGLLDLAPIRVRSFPFSQLPQAIEAAGRMRGLDLTAVGP